MDLQSVRIFHGSVWFVRAIGFAYFLWHAQTIRFHEIIDTRMERDWKRSALGKKRHVAFSLT